MQIQRTDSILAHSM